MLGDKYLNIILLIMISVLCSENIASLLDAQNSNEQKKKWVQTTSLTKFEQIISEFPYLSQNIKVENFIDFVSAKGCHSKIELARFAIVNYELYTYFNSDASQIYIQQRILNFKSFLQSLILYNKFPDMYFALYIQDQILHHKIANADACMKTPLFMYHKDISNELEKNKFLLPDPLIANITWLQTVKKIKKESQKYNWEEKDHRILFRDQATSPQSKNKENVDLQQNFFKYYHRGAFVLLSLKYPNVIDARFTGPRTELYYQIKKKAGDIAQLMTDQNNFMLYMKYRYILSADGTGAPWKIVPAVLFSKSILFKPFSSKIQWFFNELIPGKNFILVKNDLSDLLSQHQRMNQNTTKAKQLVQNSNIMANKYLTFRAIMTYTIKSLKNYAQIQKLNLTKSEINRIKGGKDIQQVIQWRRKRPIFIFFQVVIFLSTLMGSLCLKYRRNNENSHIKMLAQTSPQSIIKQNQL